MAIADLIHLDGTHNTRDLGGYVGLDGRRVRKGLLFRSDSLAGLSPRDCQYLSEKLALKEDFDLRSEGETQASPDRPIPGCRLVMIPITSRILQNSTAEAPDFIKGDPDICWHYRRLFSLNPAGNALEGMKNLYLHYVDMDSNQQAFSRLLKDIARSDGPILFHCADGKDRTGMAAAYLLSIFGVDRKTILDDYEASAVYQTVKVKAREEQLRRFGITDESLIFNMCMLASVSRCWMESALGHIDRCYGGVLNYVSTVLHLSDEEIDTIRSKYLGK